MNLTQMPLRVTTGAFILNSGVGKLKVDEGTAAFLHNGAKTAYPGVFDSMDRRRSQRCCPTAKLESARCFLLRWFPL